MARISPHSLDQATNWRTTSDVLPTTPAPLFSPCRTYRYTLWREWSLATRDGYVMFIGLNPSTADDRHDDPTIGRCISFAKQWGYGRMLMTNLFALRATDPGEMKAHPQPVGPDNDRTLQALAADAALVVAAWGAGGRHLQREAAVRALLPRLHYLKLTAAGHPGHPLYLPGDLQPTAWA